MLFSESVKEEIIAWKIQSVHERNSIMTIGGWYNVTGWRSVGTVNHGLNVKKLKFSWFLFTFSWQI